MIRVELSKIMGIHKMNIAEVSKATGIARNTLSSLYHENMKGIQLETIEKLCVYFDVSVGEFMHLEKEDN